MDTQIYENKYFSGKIKVKEIIFPCNKPVENRVEFEGVDETGVSYIFYGAVPGLNEKEIIGIEGFYTRKKRKSKYYWRIKIENFSPDFDVQEKDLVDYITGLGIEGVAKRTANKIYQKFGSETLERLLQYPESLRLVEGIPETRIEKIQLFFYNKKVSRECYSKLFREGLSYQACSKIIERFGIKSLSVLDKDPYLIACEFSDDVDIHKIDSIISKRGIKVDLFDEKRIAACIMRELRNAQSSGSTYIGCTDVEQTLKDRFFIKENECEIFSSRFAEAAAFLSKKNLVYYDFDTISLKSTYGLEKSIAWLIRRFANSEIKDPDIENDLLFQDKDTELLSEEQKKAVEMVFRNPVSIITGGPGTGKSFLTKFIYDACCRVGFQCQATAPTGRASKRLMQAINRDGMVTEKDVSLTIHRLLGMVRNDGVFQMNDDEIEIEKDVLIIDESSMIDIGLANELLRAIRFGTRIVFIGDPNQLPSVNAGNFFLDLIESQQIPVTRLTNVFRQEKGDVIIENARRINNGLYPVVSDYIGLPNDNYFQIETSGPESVELVKEIVLKKLPNYFSVDPSTEIQIYTPIHSGRCGTVNLNNVLREALNKNDDGRKELRWGNKFFRVGDKVMQTSNNYKLGVMNGDIGFVDEIDISTETVYVHFEDYVTAISFSGLDLKDLEPAYAMTVHKSQGSEIPCAVIVLDPDNGKLPPVVSRQLIYTAATRAKKAVVLVGRRSMFQSAIDLVQINSRKTRLKKLLIQAFSE